MKQTGRRKNRWVTVKIWATRFRQTLVFSLLSVTACVSNLSLANESTKVSSVRIAVVARPNSAGQLAFSGSAGLVALDGSLERELQALGIKLEWVPVTTTSVATQVNEAFANKSIDLAAYGDLPSIIANASGLQTKLILPGGSLNNTYLVVPNDSTAKSIKDLKGKRIALHRGRPWEYPFSRLLAANGLTINDVKILNLNPQAGAAAVSTGSADAFFTLSDAFLLEDKKVGKIIWSSKTPPQDWKMRAELWADSQFIANQPKITQTIVNAFVRAHIWAADIRNQAEYIRLETLAGQLETVIQRDLAGDSTDWKARWSPHFTNAIRTHYADEIDYAKNAKLISKPLNVDHLFAPQFVKQALIDLKAEKLWANPK